MGTRDREITKLQSEIASIQVGRRNLERNLTTARVLYTLGILGVLAGLALIVFLNMSITGLILLVLGGYTVVIQRRTRKQGRQAIDESIQVIKKKRKRIGELT